MGNPITDGGMAKHIPNSIQCPFCNKTSNMDDLSLYELTLYDPGKTVFVRRSYHCSCGGQILKMTANE